MSADRGRGPSRSPQGRDQASPDNGRDPSASPYGRKRASPENGHDRSLSPLGREIRERTDHDNGRGQSPNSAPEHKGSPNDDGPESPMNERYQRFVWSKFHCHGYLLLYSSLDLI